MSLLSIILPGSMTNVVCIVSNVNVGPRNYDKTAIVLLRSARPSLSLSNT